MADTRKEKDRIINEINTIGLTFQKFIKSQYAENEDFIHAADEKDNEKNNELLLKVFAFFGLKFKQLTRDYTQKIEATKSLDDLKNELQNDLLEISKTFNTEITNSVQKLLDSTILSIEKSSFLTEIVTNPNISGKQASKEMKRLWSI